MGWKRLQLFLHFLLSIIELQSSFDMTCRLEIFFTRLRFNKYLQRSIFCLSIAYFQFSRWFAAFLWSLNIKAWRVDVEFLTDWIVFITFKYSFSNQSGLPQLKLQKKLMLKYIFNLNTILGRWNQKFLKKILCVFWCPFNHRELSRFNFY